MLKQTALLLLAVLSCALSSQAYAEPATATPSAVPSFRHDIMPAFFRAGCNAGSCHGSARGKDGYMLSLFGYDPAGDYRRTVEEIPGRRVNTAVPGESLLLLKATGRVPHTGGKLFDTESDLYKTLSAWIEAGAPDDAHSVSEVTGITLSQEAVVLEATRRGADLRLTASYADGTTRDVTALALFGSNNPSVAEIDKNGRITAKGPGDTNVFGQFSRFTVSAEVIVLPSAEGFAWPNPPVNNFIDQLVFSRLKKLRITPSDLCSDESFLRRVTFDLAARPPTIEEYEAFMADESADKRVRKIDSLLASDDFTNYFAAIWGEMLRVKSQNFQPRAVTHKAADVFARWIHEQVAADRPLDEFVADMVMASGSTISVGPSNLYTMLVDEVALAPKPLAADVSQLFLGVRIQCAECHNHPFDRWTMDDYYGFVSFFSGVQRKPGSDSRDRIIFFDPAAPLAKHALDGRPMPAKLLGAVEPVVSEGDPREALAAWFLEPTNELFSRNIVNRLWAHFFDIGIVEPVDDVRATNPPSNGPLLDALAARFVETGRRLRPIIRDICASRVYQLSSASTPSNARDTRNFSHARLRRLRADVLLDNVTAVTGVPRDFPSWPAGTKAIEYRPRFRNITGVNDYALDTFGQSPRANVCACQTRKNPSLSQVMHLLVGDTVGPRVRAAAKNGGVLQAIVAKHSTPEGIIDELFIRSLGRRPTSDEIQTILGIVAEGPQPAVYEDIFAGLLTSSEFMFLR